MSNKIEAMLKFVQYDGTTNYDDKYFRHKTINNYLFRDQQNTLYRWSTKNSVNLIENETYKIQYKILREGRGWSNEIVIGFLEIEELSSNSYGDKIWRKVRQYKPSEIIY